MRTFSVTALVLMVLNGFSQKQVDFAEKYAQSITTSGLKEKLTVIASAAMQGRETATPGQQKAASYIEHFFQKQEIQAGTNGGYLMSFPIYQDTLIDATLTVRNKECKYNELWNVTISSAASGSYDIKEIVFVSYGQVDSIRNDYKDLAVKDKWVLMMEGGPNVVSSQRRGAFSTKTKIQKAFELGVKGIVIMSSEFPRKDDAEPKAKMQLKKPELNT